MKYKNSFVVFVMGFVMLSSSVSHSQSKVTSSSGSEVEQGSNPRFIQIRATLEKFFDAYGDIMKDKNHSDQQLAKVIRIRVSQLIDLDVPTFNDVVAWSLLVYVEKSKWREGIVALFSALDERVREINVKNAVEHGTLGDTISDGVSTGLTIGLVVAATVALRDRRALDKLEKYIFTPWGRSNSKSVQVAADRVRSMVSRGMFGAREAAQVGKGSVFFGGIRSYYSQLSGFKKVLFSAGIGAGSNVAWRETQEFFGMCESQRSNPVEALKALQLIILGNMQARAYILLKSAEAKDQKFTAELISNNRREYEPIFVAFQTEYREIKEWLGHFEKFGSNPKKAMEFPTLSLDDQKYLARVIDKFPQFMPGEKYDQWYRRLLNTAEVNDSSNTEIELKLTPEIEVAIAPVSEALDGVIDVLQKWHELLGAERENEEKLLAAGQKFIDDTREFGAKAIQKWQQSLESKKVKEAKVREESQKLIDGANSLRTRIYRWLTQNLPSKSDENVDQIKIPNEMKK